MCVFSPYLCVLALASRRSSTASEKKSGRGKSSTRSKSPFRSFRFKKSKPPPEAASGNYSDDEENLRDLGKRCGSSVAVGGVHVSHNHFEHSPVCSSYSYRAWLFINCCRVLGCINLILFSWLQESFFCNILILFILEIFISNFDF